ncbi:FtsX-like permease family protein [Microbacterium terricola]|uniref:ABC3 transporter permease C-terminal domain-containing protein n=1 Tax=Microbacterium terricola TaxID=344163 RepID=A0ABM8E0V3_9MICO|nr:FtsX-like permease family protein [Microbacterium terricola]UYK40830.1 hypothetical protein OAU46_04050 [Microbacterium terricola]BDV31422.1 hypothetical protein Microterr_20820 [Microbacterium terricola]
MIGGSRFAFARAREATATLLALAAVSALAAALIVGAAAAIAGVETREVRAALSDQLSDRGRVVVSVADDASAPSLEDAAAAVLGAHGVARAVDIQSTDEGIVIVPDAAAITAADLPGLIAALADLPDALDDATDARVQIAGGLERTLRGIDEGVAVRRGPTAVAVGMLGLVTAVVVGAVALEPVRARHTESLLLRARGARRRSLAGLAALESAVVALVGAAVGAVVATGLALLLTLPAAAPLVVGAAVVAVAGVAVIVAAIATARGVDRRSTRAETIARAGTAILLAVVTAVAAWQFVQSGTPVVTRGDGAAVTDPLVAIAPALVLALAALVAILLATPLARLLAASLVRTRGVLPITPLRLGGRRPARHALPIAVVAFAVGTMTVAGAYQGSLTALGDAPEALRVGADVRVTTIPDDVEPAAVAAAAQPQTGSMLVRPLVAQGADTRLPVLAAETSQLGAVMLDAGGTIDPAAIGSELTPPEMGVPLVGGDLALRVIAPAPPAEEIDGESVEFSPTAANLQATLVSTSGQVLVRSFANARMETVEDETGTYFTVDVDTDVTETIEPPSGDWSLVAIDAALFEYYAGGMGVQVSATSGGEAVDLSAFTPAPGTPGAVSVLDDGSLEFMPAYDGTTTPATRAIAPGVPTVAPAALTASLADSMSLAVGDTISLEIDQPDFEVDIEVAEIVPVLPGTPAGEGILVDLGTLSLLSPAAIVANQAWIASDRPDAAAAAVAAAYPQTVVLVADPRSGQNAAGTAIAFLLAAAGAAVLAFVVLALRRSRGRGDARELALLAVMGLGRRRAGGVRTREDLLAIGFGVVGGLAAGAVTAWFAVPPLVRAAYGTIPEAYPVPLVVPWGLLTASLLATAAICALIVSTVRVPTGLARLLREDE